MVKVPIYGGLKERKKKREEGGGVPLHSEFIARKKVVGINYFGLPFPFALLYDFKMKRDPLFLQIFYGD